VKRFFDAKEKITNQVMVGDVMHAAGELVFFVSVCSPLELMLVMPLKTLVQGCRVTFLC
jgi:hypothetical protein